MRLIGLTIEWHFDVSDKILGDLLSVCLFSVNVYMLSSSRTLLIMAKKF